MFGILYMIMASIGLTVEGIRQKKEDCINRGNAIKRKGSAGTYFSNSGVRDIETNVLIYQRKNELGDWVEYTMPNKHSYKDLRNISLLQREDDFKKNVLEAKKQNKTVVRTLDEHKAMILSGVIKVDTNKHMTKNHLGVPDYQYCSFPETDLSKKHRRYIKGDRYKDIVNEEEYVIRSVRSKGIILSYGHGKNKTYYNKCNDTLFYMSTNNGHLIRRTDNQIINDKHYVLDNAIKINETDDFIDKFNKMQEFNITKITSGWGDKFWYNSRQTINYNNTEYTIGPSDYIGSHDCDIKEINNLTFE